MLVSTHRPEDLDDDQIIQQKGLDSGDNDRDHSSDKQFLQQNSLVGGK